MHVLGYPCFKDSILNFQKFISIVIIVKVLKTLDQQAKRKQKRDKKLLISHVSQLLDDESIRNMELKMSQHIRRT